MCIIIQQLMSCFAMNFILIAYRVFAIDHFDEHFNFHKWVSMNKLNKPINKQ